MATSKRRLVNNLPPQVQAEIIKSIRAVVILLCGATLIMLIKFKLHTTEKSKAVEKSTVIEFQGGYQK